MTIQYYNIMLDLFQKKFRALGLYVSQTIINRDTVYNASDIISIILTGGYGWVPVEQPNTLLWIPCDAGDPLPRGAVHVGMDKGGDRLYAGRAFHEGDLLPAKINPGHSAAYVCWGGMEHAMSHFEVISIAVNFNHLKPA